MTETPQGGESPDAVSSVLTPDPVLLTAIFGDGDEAIKVYVDILSSRGIAWGLLGPRERSRLWDRHVLNSVALAGVVPQDALVVDVGSGAGLPGIPLALARPDLTVTLLEPLKRRADFLALAIEELELKDRVRVVRARAEEHREYYDVVTARAVANLSKLIGWCIPLLDEAGQLLALKGERVVAEVEAAADELNRRSLIADVVQVRAHPTTEATRICRVRRA